MRRDEIEALKQFEHKANDTAYNEKAVSQLQTDRQGLLRKEQELVGKGDEFQDQLKEIERKANEVLRLEGDYLYCTTSVDLKAIRDKLLEFREKVEIKKTSATAAMWVFEKLEEKEKNSVLFGKDSPVSNHFRQITGGAY
jgi:hypothetical protein